MSEFLRQRSTGSIWYGAVGMTQRKVKWLGVAPQQQAKSRSRLAVGSQIAGFLAEAQVTHPEGSLGLVVRNLAVPGLGLGIFVMQAYEEQINLVAGSSGICLTQPPRLAGEQTNVSRNDHHFGSADTPENGLDRTSRLSVR